MTETERLLLAAVIAEPENDVPRLVYADWLDENAVMVECVTCRGIGHLTPAVGHPPRDWGLRCEPCDGTGRVSDGMRERAEFIRVQIELHSYQGERDWLEQMPVEQWSGDPKTGDLLRRLDPLVRRHTELCNRYVRDCAEWSKQFAFEIFGPNWLQKSASWQWGWSRGFIDTVSCQMNGWMVHGPKIVHSHPIRRIEVTDKEPNEWTKDSGSSSFDSPTFFSWYRQSRRPELAYPENAKLPDSICDYINYMGPSRNLGSPEEARQVLSDACIAWAKTINM